ncbi:ABC transporter ATP-binding protein, partial [Dysgonomonas sp. OttesenSCG-928-M03]|nr:ABC transporter ATP-binding protein [Dysgonomonas sp. OttesenSCG-928-M03]
MAHGDQYKHNEKPKEGTKTFLRLMSYLSHDYKSLTIIGILIVIVITCNLLGSYMLRPIINDYIIPGDIRGLFKMLLILAGIYLLGVSSLYIQLRVLNKISQHTVARLRQQLFEKMEKLPIKYFDTHQHGDLMSRYTNDIDRVSDT